jgi:hypothetical protein
MSRRSKSPPQPAPAITLEDDRVYPIPYFCDQVLGVSEDTFRRICQRGEGPPITQLSPGRKGVRGKHGKDWLDGRAKA